MDHDTSSTMMTLKKFAAMAAIVLSVRSICHTVKPSSYKEPKDIAAKEPNFNTTGRACPLVDADVIKDDANFKSQDGEDRCLLHFLNGICEGQYLDLGALDGVKYSTTFPFYKTLGLDWRGVNVELIPDNFNLLSQNRHDDTNVHAAVCDVQSSMHYVQGKNNAVGGIWEFTPKQHREKWFDGSFEKIPVQCVNTQTIIDKVFGEDEQVFFDFASIDISGAELSALRGIDFDRTGFGIIVVARYKNDDNDYVADFLTNRGYERIDKKECNLERDRNHWFRNRQFGQIYSKVEQTETNVTHTKTKVKQTKKGKRKRQG